MAGPTASDGSPKPSYWLYLKLLFERFKTRGLLAGGFAVLAFIASIIWVYQDHAKPDPWVNLFTLLSVIFAALAAIWVSMQSRIEGDYSLCFALAHGYVNNFVRYALADLLKLSPEGSQFVIFRPAGLQQLDDASVNAFKAELVSRGYAPSVRVLEPEGKRARDVFMIQGRKEHGDRVSYVDFPSTLLTLASLIDYRNDAHRAETGSELSVTERQLMTQALIDCFFKEVVRLLSTEVMQGRIVFTDSRMVQL